MKIETLVPPVEEPVSLADAKTYAQIGYDGEDGQVSQLIAAGRALVEAATGLSLVDRTVRVTLDRWPAPLLENLCMTLPVGPASLLSSVEVVTSSDQTTDITDRFLLDAGQPGRLLLASGGLVWPGIKTGGIAITYIAGFGGADDVPDDLKLAVKRIVADSYARREGEMVGQAKPSLSDLLVRWQKVRL